MKKVKVLMYILIFFALTIGKAFGQFHISKTKSTSQQNTFDSTKYKIITNGRAKTYYDSSLYAIAKEANSKQFQGLEIIERKLREEIKFPLGLILIKDTAKKMDFTDIFAIPVIFHKENDTMAIFAIDWGIFHEITELQLCLGKGILGRRITDPDTRWFRDGLADYLAHKVCSEIAPDWDKFILNIRDKEYDAIGRKANLLNWIGSGDDRKREGDEGDDRQYGAALQFFIDLTHDYGDEIIPKLLKSLHGNVNSDQILKKLSRITKEDIEKRLSKY